MSATVAEIEALLAPHKPLAILPHDGTESIVQVQGQGTGPGSVWVTFGEISAEGFSPCYATVEVFINRLRF